MQLKRSLTIAAFVFLASAGAAAAQSLSPMHKSGPTPSDTKGFKLVVGNPYPQSMTFIVIPMDASFTTSAAHAVVQPNEIKLGPGLSRSVTVAFKIEPGQKERTIGVCVQPKHIEGSVLPRVCGTYTGTVFQRAGS